MGWKSVKEHYRIGHIVQVVGGKLYIGSSYVNDLIVVTPEGAITSAWDNPSGDLARYIREISADPALFARLFAQEDSFSASHPVYTFDDGVIVEHACEEFGWPNVTHSGALMYDNTFFKDRRKAVDSARKDAAAWIRSVESHATRLEDDLAKARKSLEDARAALDRLANEEGTEAA